MKFPKINLPQVKIPRIKGLIDIDEDLFLVWHFRLCLFSCITIFIFLYQSFSSESQTHSLHLLSVNLFVVISTGIASFLLGNRNFEIEIKEKEFVELSNKELFLKIVEHSARPSFHIFLTIIWGTLALSLQLMTV